MWILLSGEFYNWMDGAENNPFGLDNKKAIGEIIEFIIPETAQPLAYADHPSSGSGL